MRAGRAYVLCQGDRTVLTARWCPLYVPLRGEEIANGHASPCYDEKKQSWSPDGLSWSLTPRPVNVSPHTWSCRSDSKRKQSVLLCITRLLTLPAGALQPPIPALLLTSRMALLQRHAAPIAAVKPRYTHHSLGVPHVRRRALLHERVQAAGDSPEFSLEERFAAELAARQAADAQAAEKAAASTFDGQALLILLRWVQEQDPRMPQ